MRSCKGSSKLHYGYAVEVYLIAMAIIWYFKSCRKESNMKNYANLNFLNIKQSCLWWYDKEIILITNWSDSGCYVYLCQIWLLKTKSYVQKSRIQIFDSMIFVKTTNISDDYWCNYFNQINLRIFQLNKMGMFWYRCYYNNEEYCFKEKGYD